MAQKVDVFVYEACVSDDLCRWEDLLRDGTVYYKKIYSLGERGAFLIMFVNDHWELDFSPLDGSYNVIRSFSTLRAAKQWYSRNRDFLFRSWFVFRR